MIVAKIYLVLIVFVFAHFIGDYFLQTPYIAEGKSKSKYLLFIHTFEYAIVMAGFVFILTHNVVYTAITFTLHLVLHWVIDLAKVKSLINLLTDQTLHILLATVTAFVLLMYLL